jgi:hypothetical protein
LGVASYRGPIDAASRQAGPAQPWIEQLPEPLGPAGVDGAGGLRRTAPVGGRSLLARRVNLPDGDNGHELAARLRRLWELAPRNVEPVAGLARKDGEAWLLLQTYIGRPAKEVIERQELTTRHRVLLAADLLGGLAELHEAGLGAPSVGLEIAIVDAEGRLLLVPCWPTCETSTDSGLEVKRAGEAACRILGVSSQTGAQPGAAEHESPAVVAVARSIAAGSRRSAAEARDLLLEAAGFMASKQVASESRVEIARVVRGAAGAPPPPKVRSVQRPAATPPPVRAPAPSTPSILDRPRPGMPRWVPWGAVLLVALILAIVFLPGLVSRARSVLTPSRGAAAVGTPAPAQGTPTPVVVPQLPPAAGAVTSVQIMNAPCLPGAPCPVKVQVNLDPQPGSKDVVWNLRVVDRCHGSSTVSPGVDVTAGSGWTYVYGVSNVTLPSSGKIDIIAETTSPAVAASPVVTIGDHC